MEGVSIWEELGFPWGTPFLLWVVNIAKSKNENKRILKFPHKRWQQSFLAMHFWVSGEQEEGEKVRVISDLCKGTKLMSMLK